MSHRTESKVQFKSRPSTYTERQTTDSSRESRTSMRTEQTTGSSLLSRASTWTRTTVSSRESESRTSTLSEQTTSSSRESRWELATSIVFTVLGFSSLVAAVLLAFIWWSLLADGALQRMQTNKAILQCTTVACNLTCG